MRGGIDSKRRAELIERFELDPRVKARTYSKGNRQKVSLISAFSSRACLLLLDEPTSGLDPLMENVFQQCVHEASEQGTTVLLSSHILAETEALCERVTIIRAGKAVESGSLESMRHLSRTSIKAELIGDPGDLSRIAGVENLRIDGTTLRAHVDSESLGELIKVLGEAGVRSHGISDEVGSSAAVRDIVVRMGGSDTLEKAFVEAAFCMLSMVAAAFAVSLTLRLHQQESSQRAETLLAGAVSRTRWLTSHLIIAMAGPAVALLCAGSAAGVSYGVASGDVDGKMRTLLATAAVQLPAAWLLAALTVAVIGLAPRFAAAAWGALVIFVALYLLGSESRLSQWLLDLEPFAQTPGLATGFTATPLLVLLIMDASLIALGLTALRRRDVHG